MKQVILSPNAPKPIGPYSQAILTGNTLYVSGQIGIDPATSLFISGGIEEQTLQVLANIAAILSAAGMKISDVVKTTIFLTDMNHFAKMNEVYAAFFKEHAPARETVQVSRLPKDAIVEISIIAVKS